MPGRIMDQNGLGDLPEMKGGRSQAQQQETPRDDSHTQVKSPSQFNGLPNGVKEGFVNGLSTDTNPGAKQGSNVKGTLAAQTENVPKLDQSWRNSGAFPSLGVLMERQSQHCYQNLSRCLTAMSEIPTEPQQSNGIAPHSVQDTSKASQQKKRLLMGFAKEQREFFIKSLVLLDWCRNAEDIYKLKDVNEWQKNQTAAQMAAANAFLRMKGNMLPAKMPNPNIEGAMELLSTSKASWIPDLGYLPPKRLPAKQLLQTLRNMNVILATRLLLHEGIPEHMRAYSIADGRATFTIKGEFAVDLSVADEDPASPFYFIDIRLLYQPSSTALDNRFRQQAEWRINHILATKGLKGAYDFLHNFVLTHKINVLRSQAADMIQGKWFDCIRIETIRRSLIVQYWVGVPGKKSWIEFGVSSGKENHSGLHQTTPRMSVRWFRQGVHVLDEQLDFNWSTIDLESCIEMIVRKHSLWLLQSLQTGLSGMMSQQSPPNRDARVMDSTTGDQTLALSLPFLRTPLKILIESVTGHLTISPPSRITRDVENRVNNDASADRVKWLSSLVCAVAQESCRKEAQLLGWTLATGLLRQDNLHVLLGGRGRFSIFVPNKAWGLRWALAVTFSLGGEKWWVLQLKEQRNEHDAVLGRIITTSRPVALGDTSSEQHSLSNATLARIEKAAVSELAFAALSTELHELGVPHQIQRLGLNNAGTAISTTGPTAAMLIGFSPLMKDTGANKWKPWADETIRVTHHGICGYTGTVDTETAQVRHDLRLSLDHGKMQNLQEHFLESSDSEIAMNATGGLALKLHTPFGEPFARQLRTRLRRFEHLDRYAGSLKRLKFPCTHISLSRLSFVYNPSPQLSAELSFSSDGELSARLKLEPPGSNPHQRIRTMLEQGFNQAGERGFQIMLHILTMTLPLLQAFEQLEKSAASTQAISLHPRSPMWFTLKYKALLPSVAFHIRLRTKKHGGSTKAIWHIQSTRISPTAEPQPPPISEDFSKALDELWQSKGDHWFGVGNGINADALGVGLVVDLLDKTVRRFEHTTAGSPAAAATEGDATKTSSGPQGLSQNDKGATSQRQPVKANAQGKKAEADVITLD